MTTKLIKRTIEETINAEGEIVEKVVAIETAILDENGNEVGRVNTNQWGGNFNFNTGNMDVQAVSNGITNILIGQ
jgi:DNA topoisomerase IB